MINVVSLDKGQFMTKKEIHDKLESSRSTFQYCKFNLNNNIHIIIDYHKDFTITIQTNSRDIALYKEIQSLELIYTQQRLVDFIFRWIRNINK